MSERQSWSWQFPAPFLGATKDGSQRVTDSCRQDPACLINAEHQYTPMENRTAGTQRENFHSGRSTKILTCYCPKLYVINKTFYFHFDDLSGVFLLLMESVAGRCFFSVDVCDVLSPV